jgi:hypothetical protein
MKGLKTLLSILLLSIITSCSTEIIGPAGLDGRDGLDGINGETAFVFEYEVDFTSPDYQQFLEYQDDFQALESDVTLVYFLWEIEENGTEIWRPLPMTLFLQQGILQYSFDFTRNDVSVFMEANFPLNSLGANLTDDWIIRVVVVPGLFGTNGRYLAPVNYDNYNNVKEYYNLQPTKMAKNGYKKNLE